MFLVDSGDAAQWDDLSKHLSSHPDPQRGRGHRHHPLGRAETGLHDREAQARHVRPGVLRPGQGRARSCEIEHDCSCRRRSSGRSSSRPTTSPWPTCGMQLGEDIGQAVAERLMAERGETGGRCRRSPWPSPRVTSIEAEAAAPSRRRRRRRPRPSGRPPSTSTPSTTTTRPKRPRPRRQAMANYNKVILMGNLTRDPQLRYTPSQRPSATSAWPSTASGRPPTAR